jgi:hypothetical protein
MKKLLRLSIVEHTEKDLAGTRKRLATVQRSAGHHPRRVGERSLIEHARAFIFTVGDRA